MFLEDGAGELFNFAEGDRLKAARTLKAKAETAYAAEKVEDAKLLHRPRPQAARLS